MTALGTRILSAFLSSSQTKSVSDSSDSGSISLADKLPGLRSPSSNKQADDLSSALSSVSAATSQLSSVSEDSSQADRSRRRRRVNNINNLKGRGGARSPSPSSSESSDGQDSSDEDVNGNLKKGHKKYLQAGLYSKTTVLPDASLSNDKSLAQEASESTVDSKSSILDFGEVASTATPTPEPEAAEEADAPATTTTHSGEPTPRPRMNKRASSLAAQTKFARNGRGIRPPPKTSSQSSGSSSKKAAPPAPPIPDAPLSLPEHFKGPLLPLPIEWGEVLLEENRDFELPHPIHRDYRPYGPGRQRMLRKAGKDKQPSKYMVIRQNYYPERFKIKSEEPAICQCPKGSKCGDDCFNRMMQYLCSPKLCPAGPTCTNIPFTDRDPFRGPNGKSATKVFYTGNRGFGLKAVVDIPKDTFIMEYRGEVISKDESYKRVMNEYEGRQDFYFLDYDGDEIIDAGMKGNKARFCNHSCSPNCRMVRYRLADYDEWQIGLYSAQDIKAGTELVYDYGWVTFASMNESGSGQAKEQPQLDTRSKEAEAASSKTYEQRCHCGAEDCVGVLGAKKKKPSKKKGAAAALKKQQEEQQRKSKPKSKQSPVKKNKKKPVDVIIYDEPSSDETEAEVMPSKKRQKTE